MLEGIEILNQTEIMEVPMLINRIRLILLSTTLICALLGWVMLFIGKRKISLAGFIIAILCGITGLAIALNLNNFKEPTGKYEYQVTIDESVSMTEFYERYEVIDVEGKIYTIREKE